MQLLDFSLLLVALRQICIPRSYCNQNSDASAVYWFGSNRVSLCAHSGPQLEGGEGEGRSNQVRVSRLFSATGGVLVLPSCAVSLSSALPLTIFQRAVTSSTSGIRL
ncbi:hypothetical protein DFH07DRAFT_790476 [Mycena maculata]|uniref:Secreted protein n=1 Tax=Mycena maculata TaxID=230809 RepID=A0AAD7KC74_9AGAR|nr:hypothetical protein DFH07DRAFT_790476 [Mycena maculata]